MDVEKEVVEEEVSDVAAAWDALEAADEPEVEESGEADAPETEGAEDAADRSVEPDQPDASETQTAKEYDEATGLYYDVAPQAWKAATRESWKQLPAEVRKEIVRRERDFAQGIQRHSEAAQYGHRMAQMVQPMVPFFQAAGMDANQGLQSVLQTAAMLMGGGPQQKAMAAAQIIQQYGVDIPTLDGLLAGDPNTQQASDIDQRIQQAIQPYQQFMQQFQQRQMQTVQQRQQAVDNEVARFTSDPKNEFVRELRQDMALLLDLAAQRGENMSLQEAYDRACQLHPQISKIIADRQRREDPARKRDVAVSVSGAPGGGGEPTEPTTLREALLQAWGDN